MTDGSAKASLHTAGPWKAYIGPISMSRGLNPFFKGIVALLRSDSDEGVAVITDSDRPALDYEANARLIAVAPQMLEACEEALVYIEACMGSGPRTRVMAALAAVIAAAKPLP